MTDGHAWPPPPVRQEAARKSWQYEQILTAELDLRAEFDWPASRAALTAALRAETGLDRAQARAVVADFCDRHAVLPAGLERLVAGATLALVVLFGALPWLMLFDMRHSLAAGHRPVYSPWLWVIAVLLVVVAPCALVGGALWLERWRRQFGPGVRGGAGPGAAGHQGRRPRGRTV